MVCDPAARTLTLQRTTRSIDPNPVPLAITTGTQRRVLDARASSAGDDPVLSASLTVSDPLLDAMAFSRGRFMIETPGAAPLYLPSWAEVSRVIEDCR